MNYDEWMKEVDKIMISVFGLAHDDLPDAFGEISLKMVCLHTTLSIAQWKMSGQTNRWQIFGLVM